MFHDCGRAYEEANDADVDYASDVFRTHIEVDIALVAGEAVAAGECVAALGDRWKPPLEVTVSEHFEAGALAADAAVVVVDDNTADSRAIHLSPPGIHPLQEVHTYPPSCLPVYGPMQDLIYLRKHVDAFDSPPRFHNFQLPQSYYCPMVEMESERQCLSSPRSMTTWNARGRWGNRSLAEVVGPCPVVEGDRRQ